MIPSSSSPVMRAIGKHNTFVLLLDHGQDVQLWDWTLLNAIKAEDDKNNSLMQTYNKGTYKGTIYSQSKASQKANAKCVALLQSSLSQDAIHLILDLQDACTMRKRLLDVFETESLGKQNEQTVLLLLQFQQNKLSLFQFAKEMKRRIQICKRFGIELNREEQIQAIVLGLANCDEERKNHIANRLTCQITQEEIQEEQDQDIRCLYTIFEQ